MAYTEFYCDAANGSNLYAGSTTSTSPYTKTAGNWVQSTRVYTVQDGTNPSQSVSVGDFASVYADGASAPTGFIGRVSAVQNANNGTITIDGTVFVGSSPANGTGNRTIVVGGAWKGPNATSGFPLSLSGLGNLVNTNSNPQRVNMKNNSTYSITSSISLVNSGKPYIIQGYSSSPGDGARATIDGGTSVNQVVSDTGVANSQFRDLIFKTSFASGSSDLVSDGHGSSFVRCVFTGSRGLGLNISAGTSQIYECEFYANNKSNTSGSGAANAGSQANFKRCIFHDNTGSNTCGILISLTSNDCTVDDCIFDTNDGHGILISSSNRGRISNCEFYNNTGDGIHVNSGLTTSHWIIENCNFIKNGQSGIENASVGFSGLVFNCGYGAGTQANGAADVLGGFDQSSSVTYANDVTPWNDPANGDFTITLTTAKNAGRGAFTTTAASYGSTTGYPDIGAAAAQSPAAQKSYTFGG